MPYPDRRNCWPYDEPARPALTSGTRRLGALLLGFSLLGLVVVFFLKHWIAF